MNIIQRPQFLRFFIAIRNGKRRLDIKTLTTLIYNKVDFDLFTYLPAILIFIININHAHIHTIPPLVPMTYRGKPPNIPKS